jgi:hypothetical protein
MSDGLPALPVSRAALSATIGGRVVVRIVATIFIILASPIGAAAVQTCEGGKHGPLVSAESIPLAPVAFEAIRKNMTMWDIVALLGPAARDVGSGLMILQWNSTDGRVFLVGGTSLCQAPLYARFGPGAPPNKSLERARRSAQ